MTETTYTLREALAVDTGKWVHVYCVDRGCHHHSAGTVKRRLHRHVAGVPGSPDSGRRAKRKSPAGPGASGAEYFPSDFP